MPLRRLLVSGAAIFLPWTIRFGFSSRCPSETFGVSEQQNLAHANFVVSKAVLPPTERLIAKSLPMRPFLCPAALCLSYFTFFRVPCQVLGGDSALSFPAFAGKAGAIPAYGGKFEKILEKLFPGIEKYTKKVYIKCEIQKHYLLPCQNRSGNKYFGKDGNYGENGLRG